MMKHRHLLAVLLFAAAPACVDDPELDTEPTFNGGNGSALDRGLVGVRIDGGDRRTALVLSADLIFVHDQLVDGVGPSHITVEDWATGTGQPIAVRHVNQIGPAAILQTAPGAVTPTLTIDQATPLRLNRVLICKGYSRGPSTPAQINSEMRTTGVVDGELQVAANNARSRLERGDEGIPCIDPTPSAPRAVGYVVFGPDGVARVRPYAADAGFIARIDALAALRRAPGARPVKIATEVLLGGPAPLPPPVDSCLDIAGASAYAQASLQYYPCHGGQAQRFYIEPAANGGSRIVADVSGMCLDVPDASSVSGRDLQQSDCHGGANQRWAITSWPSTLFAPVFKRLSPASAPTMCLSVDTWNRDRVRPTEQRTCASPAAYDQRWRIVAM